MKKLMYLAFAIIFVSLSACKKNTEVIPDIDLREIQKRMGNAMSISIKTVQIGPKSGEKSFDSNLFSKSFVKELGNLKETILGYEKSHGLPPQTSRYSWIANGLANYIFEQNGILSEEQKGKIIFVSNAVVSRMGFNFNMDPVVKEAGIKWLLGATDLTDSEKQYIDNSGGTESSRKLNFIEPQYADLTGKPFEECVKIIINN